MKAKVNREDLIQSTLRLADKGFRELIPFLPKEWMELDLTAGQLRALLLLYTSGPLRMSDISSSLGVSMATATGVIDRMVERGIVIRDSDPNDRRIVLCRVSPEGDELVSGLWRAWSERAEVLLRALDRPRLLAIKRFLEALLEAGELTKGQWSPHQPHGHPADNRMKNTSSRPALRLETPPPSRRRSRSRPNP